MCIIPTTRAGRVKRCQRRAWGCSYVAMRWHLRGCTSCKEQRKRDRKSTRLNSSHSQISYAVFCLKKKKLLVDRGLSIRHIDAVVIIEKPKLLSYFPPMRKSLAHALGIEPEQINLKSKTTEGVEDVGRGEAVATYAVATLEG